MKRNIAGAASANSTAVLARRSLARARRRLLILCMTESCMIAPMSLLHAHDRLAGQRRRAAEDRVRHDGGVGQVRADRDVVARAAAVRAAVGGAARWRAVAAGHDLRARRIGAAAGLRADALVKGQGGGV